MSERIIIETRRRQEANTDPMRRCYNGAYAKSEIVWTAWETLEFVDKDKASTRLKFWKELNDYAVSERGPSAKKEFRIVEATC